MDLVQSVAVAAANAAMPGSGVLVNSGFELLKVLKEIALCVEDRNSLTEGLKDTILRFQREVSEYDRELSRLKKRSLLSQFYFHSHMDAPSAKARETADLILMRTTAECSLSTSCFVYKSPPVAATISAAGERLLRERRYLALVDSPEVMAQIADPENQKEFLALLRNCSTRRPETPSSEYSGRK
ncbi:hypothetical protein Gpo141_00006415 [Globisporangium polare]